MLESSLYQSGPPQGNDPCGSCFVFSYPFSQWEPLCVNVLRGHCSADYCFHTNPCCAFDITGLDVALAVWKYHQTSLKSYRLRKRNQRRFLKRFKKVMDVAVARDTAVRDAIAVEPKKIVVPSNKQAKIMQHRLLKWKMLKNAKKRKARLV